MLTLALGAVGCGTASWDGGLHKGQPVWQDDGTDLNNIRITAEASHQLSACGFHNDVHTLRQIGLEGGGDAYFTMSQGSISEIAGGGASSGTKFVHVLALDPATYLVTCIQPGSSG